MEAVLTSQRYSAWGNPAKGMIVSADQTLRSTAFCPELNHVL